LSQRAWRLCKQRYAARAFDGEGARFAGGRWNPPGIAVVYTSATLSLAALEMLVHADVGLVASRVDIPDGVRVRTVEIDGLAPDWRLYPPPPALQELGAAWAQALETAVLSVPSVVVPAERNYVLNPAHADFGRLRVGKAEPFSFDPRLAR
jgi:RES domain-containing protein